MKMLQHGVRSSFHKILRYTSTSLSTVADTGTIGEEIELNQETSDPSIQPLRTRKVTPAQLSIALSKRKKQTRPFTEKAVEDSTTPAATTTTNTHKKRQRYTASSINTVSASYKLRYDKVHIPERDQLITYVSHKLGTQSSIKRPFQDAYTAPSVIGTTTKDIDDRYDDLLEAGFSKKEASTILPHLPSCLILDCTIMKRMCDLLSQYNIAWRPFLYDHCYTLFLPTCIVKENLCQMKAMGMTPQVMGCVLKGQPLLFMSPFTHDTIQTITQSKEYGFYSSWVDCTVKQALLNRPAHITLGPDTASIVHILKQFKVNPNFILRKYPGFFNMKGAELLSILEVLCGDPLYLDNTMIAQVLTHCSHHVANIRSMESLRTHLQSLCSILGTTPSVQHIIRQIKRTPSLVIPSLSIEDKLSVFKGAGFTDEQSSVILNRAPSVLIQSGEELRDRLSLLLGLTDSSTSSLCSVADSSSSEHSARFLTILISDAQSRVSYCKKHNKAELLSIDRLEDLFRTNDEQFAALFGHTGVQYLKEAVAHQWLDKKIAGERISKLTYNNHRKATAISRRKVKSVKSTSSEAAAAREAENDTTDEDDE